MSRSPSKTAEERGYAYAKKEYEKTGKVPNVDELSKPFRYGVREFEKELASKHDSK